jgi:hypothetical protein
VAASEARVLRLTTNGAAGVSELAEGTGHSGLQYPHSRQVPPFKLHDEFSALVHPPRLGARTRVIQQSAHGFSSAHPRTIMHVAKSDDDAATLA